MRAQSIGSAVAASLMLCLAACGTSAHLDEESPTGEQTGSGKRGQDPTLDTQGLVRIHGVAPHFAAIGLLRSRPCLPT